VTRGHANLQALVCASSWLGQCIAPCFVFNSLLAESQSAHCWQCSMVTMQSSWRQLKLRNKESLASQTSFSGNLCCATNEPHFCCLNVCSQIDCQRCPKLRQVCLKESMSPCAQEDQTTTPILLFSLQPNPFIFLQSLKASIET